MRIVNFYPQKMEKLNTLSEKEKLEADALEIQEYFKSKAKPFLPALNSAKKSARTSKSDKIKSKDNYNNNGLKLKRARIEIRFTQGKLSDLLGISKDIINHYENDVHIPKSKKRY